MNFVDPLGLLPDTPGNGQAQEDPEKPTATKVPLIGAGLTIVVGAKVDVELVTDTEGRGGIAITVAGGVGVEGKIPIPRVDTMITAMLDQVVTTAFGIEIQPGTIHSFDVPGHKATGHAVLGVQSDLDTNDYRFSISPSAGGGVYATYTKVFQLWGPE